MAVRRLMLEIQSEYCKLAVRGWMLEIRSEKCKLLRARKLWHVDQHHCGDRHLAPGEEHSLSCGSDSR